MGIDTSGGKPRALARAVRNRWRRSFVASITLLALLGVVAFAIVIGRVVKAQIEDQAFDRAKETAQVTARAGFAPRLPPSGRRLTRRDVAELDRQLRSARQGEPGLDLRVWGRDGRVVYASEHRLIGRRHRPPGVVAPALRGRSATEVVGDRLHAAVPVVRRRGRPVAGALVLSLPYGPVRADVRRRTRRLVVALGVVALLAYALALPGLLRAGRALRAQYDPRRVELVRELRQALRRGELSLHFQPIAEAGSGRVATAEALVRWDHPRHGAMRPDRFVALVEGSDVMWPFTLRVFELAVRQCARWDRDGIQLRVAVNVSGAVLTDRRLPPEIERMLGEQGVPAERLEIEVTEGAVMRDPAAATRVLGRLGELGVGVIAIDDFGTGYSSLARLHELPLDTLKIDQSFVMRMAREGDETIVRSVVDLAHALGLAVIAEGVEDQPTWERLAELGCDFVQGYALSRPLPPDEFAGWLVSRQRPSADRSGA